MDSSHKDATYTNFFKVKYANHFFRRKKPGDLALLFFCWFFFCFVLFCFFVEVRVGGGEGGGSVIFLPMRKIF